MDKVQKYNSFNTNTPSSESYRNYQFNIILASTPLHNLILSHDILSQNLLQNSAVEMLVLLLHVLEVPDSNTSPEIDYHDSVLNFSSLLPVG
jgi:hypothetical protein